MSQSQAKLIFINRFYWPDQSATSQLLSDLAPELSKGEEDFEVHIITSRLLYVESTVELGTEQIHEGVHIHRIFTSSFGRKNLFGRTFDYLSFYIFSCIKLFFLADRNTIVIVKTDPPMLSVPCRWITRMRGAKQINWLQDVYPEIVEALHPRKLPKFLMRFLIWIRNASLTKSDMNVAISNDMANFLVFQGIPREKVSVIENWIDTALVLPVAHEVNKLRLAWELKDKTVIMYSGNMGRSHYIDTIIYAADKLKGDKNIVFLFVGDGAQKKEIQQLTKKLGLTNVLFKDYQSRELLSQSLSLGDLHIVSLKKELSSQIYPSKFYGVLAVGRRLMFIGEKKSYLARYILDNKLGYSVDNNRNEIIETLKKVKKEKLFNDVKIEKRIRKLAVLKHSLPVAVKNWATLIDSIAKKT